MGSPNLHTIHERFQALVKLAVQLEQTPRSYGTEERLTPSEIHLIERIGDHGETLSVTDLAKLLGITKGAVSQKLKKLTEYQLVVKHADPDNQSRLLVGLTAKGKMAYYAHMHWHETMDGGFKDYFNNLTSEQVDFLLEFLARTEQFYGRMLA